MRISFHYDIERFRLRDSRIIKRIGSRIVSDAGMKTGIVDIIITSDEKVYEINSEFLGHDYYTDIITFNYVEDKVISGDLFISSDRIRENSINFGNNFEEELFRVIFHGLLHLFGYDDKSEDDKILMTAKENYYLELNGFKGDKR